MRAGWAEHRRHTWLIVPDTRKRVAFGLDCQDWSATEYLGATMNGNPTVFGVNFADGRIKGYPKTMLRREGVRANKLNVRYVRGNPRYGNNDFHDNGDGTITDRATGLMWTKADSAKGMNWQKAVASTGIVESSATKR